MSKGRYARSRWWVAASCLGGFVAMFGALFARDREAFDAPQAAEAVAPAVSQPATTQRGVRRGATTQQSSRNVAPSVPAAPSVPSTTTTTRPHTRTRAS